MNRNKKTVANAQGTLNDLVRQPPPPTLYALARQLPPNLSSFHAHLKALPLPQAVDELLAQDGHSFGQTALHAVLRLDPPLSTITLIRNVMLASSPLQRNLFEIADVLGRLPLHECSRYTTSVEVLQVVYEQFPDALVREDRNGHTPLDVAQANNTDRANHAAILHLLGVEHIRLKVMEW